MSALDKISKELELIFGSELYQSICNNDVLKLTQLQAIISILIKACIDFDLNYSCGTRRTATALQLVIYLNPTTNINFVITLEAGGSVFGGSPGPS